MAKVISFNCLDELELTKEEIHEIVCELYAEGKATVEDLWKDIEGQREFLRNYHEINGLTLVELSRLEEFLEDLRSVNELNVLERRKAMERFCQGITYAWQKLNKGITGR